MLNIKKTNFYLYLQFFDRFFHGSGSGFLADPEKNPDPKHCPNGYFPFPLTSILGVGLGILQVDLLVRDVQVATNDDRLLGIQTFGILSVEKKD